MKSKKNYYQNGEDNITRKRKKREKKEEQERLNKKNTKNKTKVKRWKGKRKLTW